MPVDGKQKDFIKRASDSEQAIRDLRIALAYHRHGIAPTYTYVDYTGSASDDADFYDGDNWEPVAVQGSVIPFTIDLTARAFTLEPTEEGVYRVDIHVTASVGVGSPPFHAAADSFAVLSAATNVPAGGFIYRTPWDTDTQVFSTSYSESFLAGPSQAIEFFLSWTDYVASTNVDLSGAVVEVRVSCRRVDSYLS